MMQSQSPYFELQEVKLLRTHLHFLYEQSVEWNNRHSKDVGFSRQEEIVSRFIPSTLNLVFSFHELLLQGWLYPAEVLVRPFAERLGTLTYFATNPKEAIKKWDDGWKMGKRPSLEERLKLLPTTSTSPMLSQIDWNAVKEAKDIVISLTDSLNSAIHGDEYSLYYTLSHRTDDTDNYVMGADLKNESYATHLALVMANLTMFFPLVLAKVFPDFLLGNNQ